MQDLLTNKVRRRQKTAGRLNQRLGRRRKERFRSSCLRAELPPPGNRAFLPQLRSVDPDLELYFHPSLERWAVYRCAAHGVSPCGDFLVLEYLLAGEKGEYRSPGGWLIDELRKRSVTVNGSLDPKRANQAHINRQEAECDLAGLEKLRQRRELTRNYAESLALAHVGRCSEMGGDFVATARKRAGTKLIYGKESRKVRY